VKSWCKLCAMAESLSVARHLFFLNVLILLILRDAEVCESRPTRLYSSNQIRNGASLTAQYLPNMPDRDETVVLNLCKPN
jgi:hypothetical protein